MGRKMTRGVVTALFLIGGIAVYFFGRSLWVPVVQKVSGKRSITDVVTQYGAAARKRIRPHFEAAGIPYPPSRIILLGIKETAQLELWAETKEGARFIRTYPILALSGSSGPKLREGDKQVPEGIYKIEGLNPNSAYHLSMKLDYPNVFDLKNASIEGRVNPGTNIFIHGKAASIGCLAMGDLAIEELFVLATDVGKTNIQVAIAPTDPREFGLSTNIEPIWVSQLYAELNDYFSLYKRNGS